MPKLQKETLYPFNQKSAILLELMSGAVLTTYGRAGGSTKVNTRIGEYEKEFGISVSRTWHKSKTTWGTPEQHYDYRFNPLRKGNKAGAKKIMEYLRKGQSKTH